MKKKEALGHVCAEIKKLVDFCSEHGITLVAAVARDKKEVAIKPTIAFNGPDTVVLQLMRTIEMAFNDQMERMKLMELMGLDED